MRHLLRSAQKLLAASVGVRRGRSVFLNQSRGVSKGGTTLVVPELPPFHEWEESPCRTEMKQGWGVAGQGLCCLWQRAPWSEVITCYKKSCQVLGAKLRKVL